MNLALLFRGCKYEVFLTCFYYTGVNSWERSPSEVDEAATPGEADAKNGSIRPVLGAHIDSVDAVIHTFSALACVHLVHHS